jgi:excisionase family DNA binding protein
MSDLAEVSTLPVAKKVRVHRPLAFTVRPSAWRVSDALLQLGISRATLYKMAKNGEIRLARIGGRTLVPDAEIRRLIGEVA